MRVSESVVPPVDRFHHRRQVGHVDHDSVGAPAVAGVILERGYPSRQQRLLVRSDGAEFFKLSYNVQPSLALQNSDIIVIPEPGTVVMLFSGLIELLLVWWRRRAA